MTEKDLRRFLQGQASLYGLDYNVLQATIQCESGFQVDPKHNNISWGVAQFTPGTWKDFGHGDIMDPYSQLEVTSKMWSRGLENRWDCYRLGLYKKYLK